MKFIKKLIARIKSIFRKNPRSPNFRESNCENKNFTVAIHSGEGKDIVYQVQMWLPYFLESKIDFCIISRTVRAFNLCEKNFPDIPLYLARTNKNIEDLFNDLPMLECLFYTSNTGNNIHSIRFNKHKHIFIGHGDSDKTSSAHKAFKVYDEIWVAGQAHIDRFKHANVNMSGSNFIKVGLPQVTELVKIAEDSIWSTRLDEYSILYMPTWEGVYKEQTYSSLEHAISFLPVAHQLGVKDFAIKLHPSTGKNMPAFASHADTLLDFLQANNATTTLYPILSNIHDVLPNHNIYVCDCSAVITLCLAMNSPLFVYIPDGIAMSASDISLNHYAYTFSTPDEFIAQFQKFVSEGDYLAESRAKTRDYFLTLSAIKENAFVSELQKYHH